MHLIILIPFILMIRQKSGFKKSSKHSKKNDKSKVFKYDSSKGAFIPEIKRDYSIDYVKAHIYCADNKSELSQDNKCGCFYCLEIFDPKEITHWCSIYSENDTAICPYCGIDSIISESSGFPMTKEFLEKMNQYWFKTTHKVYFKQ